MPGSWTHLAARFVDVVTSEALNPDEVAAVESWLDPGERAIFYQQPPADQRHGHTAATRVQSSHPDRRDLIRAALLHDIGKRHARLGAIGRSLASVCIRFSLPMPARFRLYRDHGPVGAQELADLGAEPLIVEFTTHHHESRPSSVAPEDWDLLIEADHARLPGSGPQTRYAGPPHRARGS